MIIKLLFRYPLINCLILFISFGCAHTNPITMPEKYSITLWKQAGMIQNDTKIILSNTNGCSIEFNTSGVKNKLTFSPKKEELEKLIHFIQTQQFSKIKTTNSETYDRGGSSITTLFDGEKVQVYNIGSTYIKDNWKISYSSIYDSIFELAKKYVNDQLVNIELVIDDSLLDDNWKTGIQINSGNILEQNLNTKDQSFQKTNALSVFPGNNHIALYILNKSNRKYELSWDGSILVSSETRKVRLVKEATEIKIFYDDEFEKSINPENTTSNNNSILEQQNLENLGPSNYLDIQLNINEEDGMYKEFNLTIRYKHKTTGENLPLIQTFGSLVDTYAPITYTLLKTDLSNSTFLLYYSGQAGDEYNTDGKLVLFSPTRIVANLDLNGGNRIDSKLIEVLPSTLKIREAFMCHQEIISEINISENGINRAQGLFPDNTFYPIPDNSDLSKNAQLEVYELRTDLVVTYQGQQKKYSKGTKVSMQLLQVDHTVEEIELIINGEKVTMPVDNFKMHRFPQSMHGAKCEMG